METLIFNIKFFLKVAGTVVSTLIGTDEAPMNNNQINTQLIEKNELKLNELSQKQNILVLDSLQLSDNNKLLIREV